MLEKHSRQDTLSSKFDAMSDMELEEILRKNATQEEADRDVQEILHAMEVLAKRKRAEGMIPKRPEEAFESFKEYYLNENEETEQQKLHVVKKSPNWRRALSAVAAAFVILIGSSITARAMGFDLWNFIVQWTTDTFSFAQIDGDTIVVPAAASKHSVEPVIEFLESYDMTCDFVPLWLPHGFELDEMQMDETRFRKSALITYRNEDKEIRLSIQTAIGGYQEFVEKSGDTYYTYVSDGITLFLFDNYDMMQGTWMANGYECYISGDITGNEIKEMFYSMEKG